MLLARQVSHAFAADIRAWVQSHATAATEKSTAVRTKQEEQTFSANGRFSATGTQMRAADKPFDQNTGTNEHHGPENLSRRPQSAAALGLYAICQQIQNKWQLFTDWWRETTTLAAIVGCQSMYIEFSEYPKRSFQKNVRNWHGLWWVCMHGSIALYARRKYTSVHPTASLRSPWTHGQPNLWIHYRVGSTQKTNRQCRSLLHSRTQNANANVFHIDRGTKWKLEIGKRKLILHLPCFIHWNPEIRNAISSHPISNYHMVWHCGSQQNRVTHETDMQIEYLWHATKWKRLITQRPLNSQLKTKFGQLAWIVALPTNCFFSHAAPINAQRSKQTRTHAHIMSSFICNAELSARIEINYLYMRLTASVCRCFHAGCQCSTKPCEAQSAIII